MVDRAAHGYRVPETGDSAAAVLTALAENIRRLAVHDHDGVNSAALAGGSGSGGVTVRVSNPAWSDPDADGLRTHTVETGGQVDPSASAIQARDTSGNTLALEMRVTGPDEVEVKSNHPLPSFDLIFG